LYNGAEAFVFPSLSEGFGWPVIEAQACGTPVVTSNFQPMLEVSGNAALHADPKSPKAFAEALMTISNINLREELIKLGFENTKRFYVKHMIESYLKLYN